jgi:hypothetical protein
MQKSRPTSPALSRNEKPRLLFVLDQAAAANRHGALLLERSNV